MKRRLSPVISAEAQEIGNNISLYRRMSRIPLVQLAERANISADTLSRLERGDAGVSIGAVLSVCRVLGLDSFIIKATEPSNTAYGRAQLQAGVPQRVR